MAIVVTGIVGCAEVPEPAADVALRIAGHELHYDAYEAYLRRNVGDAEQLAAQGLGDAVLGGLFDQFVDERLLARLATDRGWAPADPGAVDHREALAFLLQAENRDAVSEQAIADYYDTHRAQYERPEQVRLWQILVSNRAKADAAIGALAGGESFKAVAARLATDPDANYCGEQGLLARDDLPPAFADRIFALSPAGYTEVLEADQGFYIFMVEERFGAASVGLDRVAGEIRDALLRARMDEMMVTAAEEARARYTVDVFPSNLPFDYQGRYVQTESQ